MLRVSYSVLDPWARGDYEEAINRYLRRPTITTPAMAEGKIFHEQWRAETEREGKLPKVFGSKELMKPECEVKLTCILDDWIEFVGVIDLLDAPAIHEYKTGNANSLFYASTMQIKCYQFLLAENGYAITKGYIHHYSQKRDETTHSKIYLSDYTRTKARDWIVTYASELKDALDKLDK